MQANLINLVDQAISNRIAANKFLPRINVCVNIGPQFSIHPVNDICDWNNVTCEVIFDLDQANNISIHCDNRIDQFISLTFEFFCRISTTRITAIVSQHARFVDCGEVVEHVQACDGEVTAQVFWCVRAFICLFVHTRWRTDLELTKGIVHHPVDFRNGIAHAETIAGRQDTVIAVNNL